MSLAQTRVCPQCGAKFGPNVEICPTDGRLLVRDGEISAPAPVRLSSATEELLGSILVSSGDGAAADDVRDDGKTALSPSPFIKNNGIRERSATHTEATVTTPMESNAGVVLEQPLAELPLKATQPEDDSDEETLLDAPLDPSLHRLKPALELAQLDGTGKGTRRKPSELLTDLKIEINQNEQASIEREATIKEVSPFAESEVLEKTEIVHHRDLKANTKPLPLIMLALVLVGAIGFGLWWLALR